MIRRLCTSAWLALPLGAWTAQAAACDRTCLEGVMDTYLTALAAHNASMLPTTPGVTYVENDQVLPLGTGEWQIAGAPGRYRHVLADPEAGQVGAITTITENGVRIIYVVRLQVETDSSGSRVREVETQITRDAAGAALYENMTAPEPVWLAAVPADQRVSRATLVARANQYYAGMERNDPRGNYSFFDPDCNRLEDAVPTTNQQSGAAYGHSNDTVFASLGCAAQFQTGFLGFVTRIRARRFAVVDEARQAVLALTTLDHNGTVRFLPDLHGVLAPIPAYFDVPRSLQAAEAFRLRRDKLFRIEMTLTEVPYRMRSPYEPREDLDGDGNRTGTPGTGPAPFPQPCDRACLGVVVERVLQALLAHNASRLPLADGARYAENGQRLEWDNGLWATLGAVSWPGRDGEGATLALASPADNTAGYWGRSREQTTPGVLALRIRLDKSGRVAEMEALAVRAEATGARGGTMTLMRPPLPVEWEGDALGPLDPLFLDVGSSPWSTRNATRRDLAPVVSRYFDALAHHASAAAPFAAGCTRRDNGRLLANTSCAEQADGHGATPNGLFPRTTAVRDRRVLVQDAARGVVLAVAMVDNPALPPPGTAKGGALPATERVPGTYMVPQLIKVDEALQIVRVESMIKWMPFGYTADWPDRRPSNGTAPARGRQRVRV